MPDLAWPKFDVSPPGNEKLEILQKFLMADLAWPKFDVPPPARNEKLEIWQKLFYARFGMTKVRCKPPLEMKSWKSCRNFLWQIWHDQSLMYPPRNEKLEIWQKKIYARFGMTKVWHNPPPQNEKLEIWWKCLCQIWHDQSLMYTLWKGLVQINQDSTAIFKFLSVLIIA